MGEVTFEQANLMLRIFELRREPRLRQARTWFDHKFNAATPEEIMKKYPPSSEENTNIRMVVGYWDMVAGIVNRGLIDEEFFFESNGEGFFVWEKIKHIAPAWRAALKDPTIFANLEEYSRRLEAWREKRAPGSTAAMRQMVEQMSQTAAKAAGE